MKQNRLLSVATLWLLALLLTACATGPLTLDPKYTFTEFESVDSLSNFNLSGWEVVDARSLIVHTGPSDHYLLILGHAMPELHSAETILLTSTGSRIQAKFDCVEVVEPTCTPEPIPAVIRTIYRLPDRDSITRVKDRIRNQ